MAFLSYGYETFKYLIMTKFTLPPTSKIAENIVKNTMIWYHFRNTGVPLFSGNTDGAKPKFQFNM